MHGPAGNFTEYRQSPVRDNGDEIRAGLGVIKFF